MTKSYLFDKVSELKQRFSDFFQHRKKIKALENYAEVGYFKHRNYLSLIKQCMQESFLEEKESDFLDHMLTKYEINYLDWAHRTRWLKLQMAQVYAQNKLLDKQLYFDFDKQAPTPHIPFEVMLSKTNTYQRSV